MIRKYLLAGCGWVVGAAPLWAQEKSHGAPAEPMDPSMRMLQIASGVLLVVGIGLFIYIRRTKKPE